MEGFEDKKTWKQSKFLFGVGGFVVVILAVFLVVKFSDRNYLLSNFSASISQTLQDVFGVRHEKSIYELDLSELGNEKDGIEDGNTANSDSAARGAAPSNTSREKLSNPSSFEMKTFARETVSSESNTKLPTVSESNRVAVLQKVFITEVAVGSSASTDDEFVEIYNPNETSVDLTGWSVKKKSASGTESVLISSKRFQGKIIPSRKYFLMVSEEYRGKVTPDIFWPKSYELAYENNSLITLNANGEVVDEVRWTKISKNKSYARVSLDISAEFGLVDVPSPQNSQE
ncbi:MAG: Uncharacterized protein G01um101420_128 [Parcubacteria group bacterium Gr01-1014_20]|nr:MAG: Uncharacterized protein G01um101420_128 [Parcubacteria group bacterium Gr01-1014_20]